MKPDSFTRNAIITVLAALIAAVTFLRIGRRFFVSFLPHSATTVITLLLLLAALVFLVYWYRRHRRGSIQSPPIQAWWVDLMCYAIALDLSTFGWQKFFLLQFFTPIGKLDEPFSQFGLQDLMWAFYGKSYPFLVAVGLCQIAGSALLVFHRTRLLGAVVLFPVMLNIILINTFYHLDPGVQIHAGLVMSGLVYLLLADYKRLKAFFLPPAGALTTMRNVFSSTAFRLSVIYLPLIIILPYVYFAETVPLKGKYDIRRLTVNGAEKNITSCDSLLTRIYLEYDVVCEFNSQKKRLYGQYQFDPRTHDLKAVWHYPPGIRDTLKAKVQLTNNVLHLDGIMGSDTLKAEFIRANE